MNNYLKKIKAVGFDLDGTLYHSPEEFSNWIRDELKGAVAKKLGKTLEEAAEIFTEIKSRTGSTTLALDEVGLQGEVVFQDLFDRAPLTKYIKPDHELSKKLKELAKKYRLFIISNGAERQVKRKMDLLELKQELFEMIISCYDHEGWTKPNPGAFVHVLDEMKLAPREVLFVGDREATDIEGARAVGMKTAMVYGESELADVSCVDIAALFELV